MKYHVEFKMPAQGKREHWCVMVGSYTALRHTAKAEAIGLKKHFNVDTRVVDRYHGEVLHECRASQSKPYMEVVA